MDKNHLIEQLGKTFGDNPRFRALAQQEALLSMVSAIKEDTRQIRAILNMEAEPSIDYSFLSGKFKIQREELELDNLKMENMRLKMVKQDRDKLMGFATFGARQVENLLRIYYSLIDKIELEDYKEWIKELKNPKWHNQVWERVNKLQKGLPDLSLYDMIMLLEYIEDFKTYNLMDIKELRNSIHPAQNEEEKQKRSSVCRKIDDNGGYNMVRREVQAVCKIVKRKSQEY